MTVTPPPEIQVDNPKSCIGVHWDVGHLEAIQQFVDWGFRGISGFHKVQVLNGNLARTQALAIAVRDDGVSCFWRGSYDAGVGADSALYRFDYEEYVGPSQVHGDTTEAKAHADWTP